MNVFDKFLNAIRLNDDFDEDDEYFEDEPVEETPKKTKEKKGFLQKNRILKMIWTIWMTLMIWTTIIWMFPKSWIPNLFPVQRHPNRRNPLPRSHRSVRKRQEALFPWKYV